MQIWTKNVSKWCLFFCRIFNNPIIKIVGQNEYISINDARAAIQEEVNTSDIVIVATGAQDPTVYKSLIQTDNPLLILDLSIPKNVNEDVRDLDNVTLVHLDDLAKITDKTLEKRKAYIPKAEAIISEITTEFNAWLDTLKFVPTIQAIKHKLTDLKNSEVVVPPLSRNDKFLKIKIHQLQRNLHNNFKFRCEI